MCHSTKYCQTSTLSPSQRASSSNCCRSHSCSCSIYRVHSQTLLLALAVLLLMPSTHARRLSDQLALGLAYEDADSSSANSDSSDSLPAWDANPLRGLAESFGDASYDSDISSSSSSSSNAESDSSYEQITQAAVQAVMRELRRQRIRHRRSHMFKYFANDLSPEWENPCGGVYQPNHFQPRDADVSMRVNKRKYLMALRNNTKSEYVNIQREATLSYGDMKPWQLEYKFLPNMSHPTNVTKLKTWYRNMQVFVGSFAYLGKAHYHYQNKHQLGVDQTTKELHKLLISARSVLCEIETTINASYPHINVSKLTHVSKEEMKERLQFYTSADGNKQTDIRDLKFTKDLYFQHLKNMARSLHLALVKHRNSHGSSERRHSSLSSFNSRQSSSQESSEGNSGRGLVANDSGCSSAGDC